MAVIVILHGIYDVELIPNIVYINKCAEDRTLTGKERGGGGGRESVIRVYE